MQIIEAIIKSASKVSRAVFSVKTEATPEQKIHAMTNQYPETREDLRTAKEVTFSVKAEY